MDKNQPTGHAVDASVKTATWHLWNVPATTAS